MADLLDRRVVGFTHENASSGVFKNVNRSEKRESKMREKTFNPSISPYIVFQCDHFPRHNQDFSLRQRSPD
jgi:hypothetical protein